MSVRYDPVTGDQILTGKQARFVQEYCVDLNAKQAAIRAGYSQRTAVTLGSEALRKPHVAKAIAERQKAVADKIAVSQERVVREIARLALSSIKRVLGPDGRPLPVQDWPDDMAAAVSSIKIVTDQQGTTTHEIKLWDKNSALDKLSKHLGVYEEQVTVKVEDNRTFSDNDKARAIAALLSRGLLTNGVNREPT